MPLVEVFEGENENEPIFIGEFAFMPRVGEYISRDAGGYFRYYNILETWYRQVGNDNSFKACVRVKADD